MKRVALFLLVVCTAVFAGPVEDAADKVLAVVKVKGDLGQVAAANEPDPWMVADELLRRGQHDAAMAFAKAAPRPDTAKLPTYLESRRGKRSSKEARVALEAARRAMRAGNYAAVLAAIDAVDAEATDVVSIRLQFGRAIALRQLGHPESVKALRNVVALAERIGWLAYASRELNEVGMAAYRRGDLIRARAAWERNLAIEEARGNGEGVATIAADLGVIYKSVGEHAKALAFLNRSLKFFEESGNQLGTADALLNIGNVHMDRANYAKARDYQSRALRAFEALRDRVGIAGALGNLGVIHMYLGDLAQALEYQSRALTLREELRDRNGIVRSLMNLGVAHGEIGDHAKALDYCQRAFSLAQKLQDRMLVAAATGNLGNTYLQIGDYARSLVYQERAVTLAEQLGDRVGVAGGLGNIGLLHLHLGDYPKSLEYLRRSLALKEELGDRRGVIEVLGNIGNTYLRSGESAKALACHERTLEMFKTLGDRAGVAGALLGIGGAHLVSGSYVQAVESLERARESARKLGLLETELSSMANLAESYGKQGKLAEAVRMARQVIARLPLLVGRLDEEQGARARERWARLFQTGVVSGWLRDDSADAFFFLESSRAGSLMESLGGRDALSAVAIPVPLRKAELSARTREQLALARYRRAYEAGEDGLEELWGLVETARAEILDVVAGIQRSAKLSADVIYPRAAALRDVQATLHKGEVLVIYAYYETWAGALVVERGSTRLVDLGDPSSILKAGHAFRRAVSRGGVRGMRPPPHESAPYLKKRLRKLILEPLKLGEGVRRILVSPYGDLTYLPLAALTEREVVWVPSATTYHLLRNTARPNRGEKVLALGDPMTDDRLPASAAEARAVGDTILLREEATKTRLVASLATEDRWRAVHLACHGTMNPERPLLSELGVSGEPLRCFDIIRATIPADLVVLSACETGKGKIYKAEGMIGWTRAFMFAGAPRVIVSLWKVDDAATRALMEKFYELWKPGKMPTATALKKAQEHVASQPQWKHPYFWAAWQLWGLGE